VNYLVPASALSYNRKMLYIVLGVLGFLAAYAFDWFSLRQIPILKQLFGLLAVCLLLYSTAMVCLSQPKFTLPFFTLPLGACLLLISLSLLIYSLFIEIPFHSTYAEKGIGTKLITTGTYALTRHPGVIWLALVYLSLAIFFPSPTLFLAVTVWLIMDIIYVVLQDRIFFPEMFPDYHSYQQKTPFLIPTKQSISACLKTINPRKRAKNG
jgi:protein-S-isoprenylcysteine O-methyltransferase Ste14